MKLYKQIRDDKFNEVYQKYVLKCEMKVRKKLLMNIYLTELEDIYINTSYIVNEVINGFDKNTRGD